MNTARSSLFAALAFVLVLVAAMFSPSTARADETPANPVLTISPPPIEFMPLVISVRAAAADNATNPDIAREYAHGLIASLVESVAATSPAPIPGVVNLPHISFRDMARISLMQADLFNGMFPGNPIVAYFVGRFGAFNGLADLAGEP